MYRDLPGVIRATKDNVFENSSMYEKWCNSKYNE